MKKKFILFAIPMLLLTACSSKNTLKCTMESDESGEKIKATMKAYFDSETGKYKNQDMDIEATAPTEEDAKAAADDKETTCYYFSLGGECSVSRSGKVVKIKVRNGVSSQFEGMTKEEVQKMVSEDKTTKCS